MPILQQHLRQDFCYFITSNTAKFFFMNRMLYLPFLLLLQFSFNAKAQQYDGRLAVGYFPLVDRDSTNVFEEKRIYSNFNVNMAIGVTEKFFIGLGAMAWTLDYTSPFYNTKNKHLDFVARYYWKDQINDKWNLDFGLQNTVTKYAVDKTGKPVSTPNRRLGLGINLGVARKVYK